MYARQPPTTRISRPMQIPSNYSGNAFSAKEEPPVPPEEEADPSEPVAKKESEPKESAPVSMTPKLIGNLFGKGNRSFGLGSEELLLLGVILLISQNDSRDDLLLLLILLLFL